MPSVYFERDSDPRGEINIRMLEIKIHYLMSMLEKANLLLDAYGVPTQLSNEIREDAEMMRSALKGEHFK